MKYSILFIIMFGSLLKSRGQVVDRPENFEVPAGLPSVYDIPMVTLDGKTADLGAYRARKMLIVNLASECGYTYQYEDLQKLHERFADRLVVLGIPSNQFGEQEPGTAAEIREFCDRKYGVTFPLFEKSNVKGKNKTALYRWLSDPALNGWNDKEPSWNFNKYLVNERGELVSWFSSKVKPLDETVLERIR